MKTIKVIGLIASGSGVAGIMFLLHKGTPLLSFQNVGSPVYYPAGLGYVYYILVFGVGLVLLALYNEAS
ncbi:MULTISPECIES: hypothetical protein [Haloferax]|uniref:Uncharacterized protein n=1 Tax=Haloferax larsenii TaxID=302484 RepID=A0A1H7TTG7_HALLR|nr:hypothetical protein [Haloferax larsenii]SEL87766.1 hypothetical protein SAMN04488691_11040 [Haloferax larsenii]